MKTNIAGWERVLRVLLGTGLLVVGLAWFGGAELWVYRFLAVAVSALGLDFVITGAIGFCPLYHKLGWSTARRETR